MSHFYGKIQGQAGEATRRGSRKSGITTYAASWQGAVRVHLYEHDGQDCALVSLVPWQGRGISRCLYDGPVSEYQPAVRLDCA